MGATATAAAPPVGELLTAPEVSARLKIPIASLYQWRLRNYGPPAVRVGRFLRYPADQLERWIRDQAAGR